MSSKEVDIARLDWEKLAWEETPYSEVYVSLIDQEHNPTNPKIPKHTVIAVRVNPGGSIPLHRHNREPGWTETLTFSPGANFTILRITGQEIVITTELLTFKIGPGEDFGLVNNDSSPLYFLSRMKPGFTGYQEIEEVT